MPRGLPPRAPRFAGDPGPGTVINDLRTAPDRRLQSEGLVRGCCIGTTRNRQPVQRPLNFWLELARWDGPAATRRP
jgi:hypothetical protein